MITFVYPIYRIFGPALILIFTRWSRQQAIEYMLNHTFITHKEASKEIDRYITWPGQACAYKVGEMKIKELRREAEHRLGE